MEIDIQSDPLSKYLCRAIGADDYAVPTSHIVTVLVGEECEQGQYRLYYIKDEALLITDEGIKLVEDVPALLDELHTIAKQDEARCSVPVGHLRRAARTGDIAPVEMADPTRVRHYPPLDSDE